MKDIKTKPTNTTPKVLEKASNIPKDAKAIAKEHLLEQADKLRPDHGEQFDNPTNYATDKVEGGMDAAFHKTKHAAGNAKDFAIKKFREHRAERAIKEKTSQGANSAAYTTPHEQPLLNVPKTRENTQAEPPVVPSKDKIQEQARLQKKQIEIKRRDNMESTVPLPSQQTGDTTPVQKSDVLIKTKEEYLKSQQKPQISERKVSPKMLHETPKEKQTILSANGKSETVSQPASNQSLLPKQRAKEYIKTKQQQKNRSEQVSAKTSEVQPTTKTSINQAEMKETVIPHTETPDILTKPDRRIKTKEYYRTQQNDFQGVTSTRTTKDGLIKTKKADIKFFDRMEKETQQLQSIAKSKSSIASTKQDLLPNTRIKQKSKTAQPIKNRPQKATLFRPMQPIKTANRTIKRANPSKIAQKKAVAAARKKAAQQAAQRTAQAAKAATKATVKLTVKVAQLVVAAAKALISAIAALGGWAVLLVILIVIIIVAAVAASPFGIFISEEAEDANNIPISSIVAECNIELSNQLNEIESGVAHNRVVMEGEQASWDLVIALFAVKVAGTEDETAQDVVIIDENKKEILKQVFWDIHSLSSRTETVNSGGGEDAATETVLYITINAKTKEEMIAEYGFTDNQQKALATLLENSDILIASSQSLVISDGTAKGVIDALPENLSPKRKAVIKAACSLVGKVNYFWGGKSSAIGWDSEWGKLKTVTSAGSSSTGTKRPFGLDCSGFVTWAYINSGFTASQIGHGTQGQIAKCTRIPWNSAEPGDLAFLSDLSHVGIVAGKDENGNILVIHCSSSANNVVITTNSIFGFAARPNCY